MIKEKRKNRKYSVPQNCLYVLKDAVKNYPLVMVTSLLISFVSVAVSLPWTYLPSAVVEGIEQTWGLKKIVLIVAALVAAMAVGQVVTTYLIEVYTMQSGTHEELVKENGSVYKRLWNAQAQYYA